MGAPATTPEQRAIMSHAIGGWTKPKRGAQFPWRNYYCANVADDRLRILADAGLMEMSTPTVGSDMRYYHVTQLGFAALGIPWPKRWE